METIVLQNERVRVTRVTLAPGEKIIASHREDRVVIFLQDHEKAYATEGAQASGEYEFDIVARKAGEAIYRPASTHSLESTADQPFETLIIELL